MSSRLLADCWNIHCCLGEGGRESHRSLSPQDLWRNRRGQKPGAGTRTPAWKSGEPGAGGCCPASFCRVPRRRGPELRRGRFNRKGEARMRFASFGRTRRPGAGGMLPGFVLSDAAQARHRNYAVADLTEKAKRGCVSPDSTGEEKRRGHVARLRSVGCRAGAAPELRRGRLNRKGEARMRFAFSV